MNWPIFFIGLTYGLIETHYFGWNNTPQSEAELICDGIATLICALAFVKVNKLTL